MSFYVDERGSGSGRASGKARRCRVSILWVGRTGKADRQRPVHDSSCPGGCSVDLSGATRDYESRGLNYDKAQAAKTACSRAQRAGFQQNMRNRRNRRKRIKRRQRIDPSNLDTIGSAQDPGRPALHAAAQAAAEAIRAGGCRPMLQHPVRHPDRLQGGS